VRVDGPDKTQALHLAEARLDEARLDYGARRMMLGALHLSGTRGSAAPVCRRSVQSGAADAAARTPVAAKASRVKADGEAQATPSWYVHLADFALTNGAVLWEDHAVGPTVRMKVTGIDLASGNLDTDMVRPLDLRFAMRINGAARLSGEGTVAPRTGAGQVGSILPEFRSGRCCLSAVVAGACPAVGQGGGKGCGHSCPGVVACRYPVRGGHRSMASRCMKQEPMRRSSRGTALLCRDCVTRRPAWTLPARV
jgi:hypothetical protein